jgi:Domain of unknown function (DUF4166)
VIPPVAATANLLPLYRRLLGDAFDRLPPVWRRFHDSPTGGSGSGTFRVTRGKGRLANLLANLGGLPRAGDAVPVRLRVVVEGERERWVREFPACRMETVQWARDGLLVEAVGPVRLGLRVQPEGEVLRFDVVRAWVLGVPVPRWLAPRASAVTVARDDAWEVDVSLAAPLLGLLVRYQGLLTPDPPQ